MATDTKGALGAAGLRITRQRVAVMEAIRRGEHVDVDTIVERARDALGTVSTQAVYDVLRALDRGGLIRKIEPAGKPALYEVRVGDNHHHLVCRQCGSITDVDCVTGLAPCLDAPLPDGFDVDEAEITWWGTCPECRNNGR